MPVDPNRESWKPGMAWERAIEDIEYVRGLGREMGGPERIARQHAGGRYTVRERIDRLVDADSFVEAGPLVGAAEYDADGNLRAFTPGAYVMGLAEIDGRPVAVGGDDFTISGGSPHNVRKHPRDFMQPLALQYGIPYVQLVEGVGHSSKADEAEGHMGLPAGDMWWRMVEVLRTVPVPFRLASEHDESYAVNPMVELDGDGDVRLLRFNTQQMKTIPLTEPRLAEYYAAYHELSTRVNDSGSQVSLRLEGGHILLIAAHRVLHGRTALGSVGRRHLQDAYFEHDNVRNHLNLLHRTGRI